MSLLSHVELLDLVRQGVITADPANVNGTSIDVTLGETILVEDINLRASTPGLPLVRLAQKEIPFLTERKLPYRLRPGEFALAHTVETFNLPDYISAEFKLRSSVARAGLNHALAGWCDPGWHGAQLTLELASMLRYHEIEVSPGMRIGQVIFYSHEPVPGIASYSVRGRYNNTQGVARECVS
jgi:dCTP deaminase